MKPSKVPSLVSIAILTTITIVFWVIFNVYRNFTEKPAATIDEALLAPLSPSLDVSTIDKMERGLFFEEGQ